jgi:hypothetical protein
VRATAHERQRDAEDGTRALIGPLTGNGVPAVGYAPREPSGAAWVHHAHGQTGLPMTGYMTSFGSSRVLLAEEVAVFVDDVMHSARRT